MKSPNSMYRSNMRIIDPVCRMDCDDRYARFRSEYGGNTYSFCSLACKKMFDRDPEKYLQFWKNV